MRPRCPPASALSDLGSTTPARPSRDDSLPISALQHWLYCPRQCALIHVERLWAENRLTAEGRVLHERVDGGSTDRHKGIKSLRAVQLGSERLGLHGVADLVELHGTAFVPVEYKRGRPKPHRADEVQLCAQALCLEEMTGQTILEGALFYGKTRRRVPVPFDDTLRSLTSSIASEVREAFARDLLPAPTTNKRLCKACSLAGLCRPEQMRAPPEVKAWISRQIASEKTPRDAAP